MGERKVADGAQSGVFGPASPATPKGFSCSASRIVSADVDRAFAAWTDERKRRQWCRNDQLVITETTPSISLHGDWGNSRVRVFFMPRGPSRVGVTVDHEGLPTARKAEQMKKLWQARLGRFSVAVEGSRS